MSKLVDFTQYKIDDLVFSEFLPEMFKRVGLNPNDVNDMTKEPNWIKTNKWTVEDENEFVKWLTSRLMHKLRMTRTLAEKEARKFVFQWGWSTDEEKQGELF